MNDRPTVIILDYLMKDKLSYWVPVLVSQAVKIWWITKDVKKLLAFRLNNFLSFTVNLIQHGLDTIIN